MGGDCVGNAEIEASTQFKQLFVHVTKANYVRPGFCVSAYSGVDQENVESRDCC